MGRRGLFAFVLAVLAVTVSTQDVSSEALASQAAAPGAAAGAATSAAADIANGTLTASEAIAAAPAEATTAISSEGGAAASAGDTSVASSAGPLATQTGEARRTALSEGWFPTSISYMRLPHVLTASTEALTTPASPLAPCAAPALTARGSHAPPRTCHPQCAPRALVAPPALAARRDLGLLAARWVGLFVAIGCGERRQPGRLAGRWCGLLSSQLAGGLPAASSAPQ